MIAGAALAACAITAPVAAQTVDDDVRCLLAANVFARAEKDPAKRQNAIASSIFFLGRLDGRISTEQLKVAVAKQVKTMPAASLGPTMTDCFKRVVKKGIAMHDFNVGPVGQKPPAKANPPAKKK